MVLPRFYHRTDVNFTYVKSVACLATVLSFVQSLLNQSSRGAVAVSPGLPAPRLALAWSSSVGDLAVELTVVRLMLGLQSRVLLDVVGVVFVGLGGETVLGCVVEVGVPDLTLVVLLQRN